MADSEHERWMAEAIAEAEKAFRKDEVPVGAVLVYEGEIIARGHNLIETLQDPTAHAEMLAIVAAANNLASWRLTETSLYVTLEPCTMCTGAILLSRISKVIYGCPDPRMGACGSVLNIPATTALYAKTEIIGGVNEATCHSLLKSFFHKLRNK